jgi:DNA-binding PadR family transcriptional regulator
MQQLTLTAIQISILMIIKRFERRLGQDEISVSVEKLGIEFSEQALSNILTRLTQSNLVDFKMSEPRKMAGGRPRRLYQLTANGEFELEKHRKFLLAILAE